MDKDMSALAASLAASDSHPATAPWHQMEAPAVLEAFGTSASGLGEGEAEFRHRLYGPNVLITTEMKSPWLILWQQLTTLLMIVLHAAIILSIVLGDYGDALLIAAIVILNAVLGFQQEYRAEGTLAALKKLAMPLVRVRRDGEVHEARASLLVPGDIVLLEGGNVVPADCRLVTAINLRACESALTGEAEEVLKTEETLRSPTLALGDRRNMTYMGTHVSSGRGEAIVTAIGMHTELGGIASLVRRSANPPTPLQQQLNQLAKWLAGAAALVVVVIIIVGRWRGEELKSLLLTAVSAGVAAVPEGLATVVTIALSLGARRMLRRNALIRKPAAIEALGSITVICTDKTGTLTRNQMAVTTIELADGSQLALNIGETGAEVSAGFRFLVSLGALCNDAQSACLDQSNEAAALGDATEKALLRAAEQLYRRKTELEALTPRVSEIAFAPERRRMTTVHQIPSPALTIFHETGFGAFRYVSITKGAMESVLVGCTKVWLNGRSEPLDRERREILLQRAAALGSRGLRVLGVAVNGWAQPPVCTVETLESELTFVGMVGMMDPPRHEALLAIKRCNEAGIRPVMLTGDHPATALSIAKQLGIAGNGTTISGSELDLLSETELDAVVASTQVYARVSPENKLRIVQAFQRRGQTVAMTGDGVNDAPALKTADVGVAMGVVGTDVAREAADIVLLDDNFATIVAAVEEGRVIYDNLRKFIRYILTTNAAEVWVMLLGPAIGMPLPLYALQILWMNLLTDGLPALALSAGKADADVMRRLPRQREESILGRGLGFHVLWVGLFMAIVSLGISYVYWRRGDYAWQTLLFTTLTFCQMGHLAAARAERRSLFKLGLASNVLLLSAICFTIALQLASIYVPFFQLVLGTIPLAPVDLALAAGASITVCFAVEVDKWIRTKRDIPEQG